VKELKGDVYEQPVKPIARLWNPVKELKAVGDEGVDDARS